jgi:hypothetical protein
MSLSLQSLIGPYLLRRTKAEVGILEAGEREDGSAPKFVVTNLYSKSSVTRVIDRNLRLFFFWLLADQHCWVQCSYRLKLSDK